MNVKRMVIGTLVGGVVLYAVGYLFWEMLFDAFFDANDGSATGVERAAPIIWAVVLGNLFYAKLITLTLEGKSGSPSIADGLKIGAIVGLLLWGTADFILYGFTNLNNLTGTIADTLLEGVHGGIAGAAIAFALAKFGD